MPPSSNSPETSFCIYHPGRLSIARCIKCDRPVCGQCQVVFKGRMYCRDCAAQPQRSDTVPMVRRPFLAALLSLVIPGMGQVYNGQVVKAIIIFLTSWLIVPWIYGIFEAFVTANKINQRVVVTSPPTAYFSGCLVIVAMLCLGPFLMVKIAQQIIILRNSDLHDIGTRHNLRVLSRAIEQYAKDKGEYPTSYEDLYFANPPYIQDIYCDTVIDGYAYRCIFSKDGYTIQAIPVGGSDRMGYTIGTGGGLFPEKNGQGGP